MLCRLKDEVLQIALGLGLVLLVGRFVTAQDVKTNYLPGTDFSKYKTYKWVNIEGGEQTDQILDKQIKRAVDARLASKGMTKTDDEKADMYVGSQLSISQESQWNAYGTGLRWGCGITCPVWKRIVAFAD